METIEGFKTFNKNRTNRYGRPFEEGKIYEVKATPIFGNKGVGFHFCSRLEDTLRYFPAMEEEVEIARVTSLGESTMYNDEYYGYYEMYSTNKIKINRFLTREEIIKMYLKSPPYQLEDRVIRFLQGYRLSKEEIALFKLVYMNHQRILECIAYYQEGIKDTYEKGYSKQRLKGKQN